MADRQKQQVREAVRAIRDGLKYQLDQSDKLGETAFTARSRDIGITNPDIQKEITKRQVAKGAMGAAYVAADVFLNPENYTPEALKDKQLPQGLNINIDYKGLGFGDVAEGRLPAVGARYEKPVELGGFKGTAGISGRYDPESKGYEVGARVTGRFAKGGKVKKYAKGGGIRKPKLK
jgi:hypothetical protein